MNKKLSIRLLWVVAILLVAASPLRAQEAEYSVYYNGLLPVNQFNNSVELSDGDPMTDDFIPMNRENLAMGAMAGMGGTLRAGIWFDLGFGELMPFAEAGLCWNATKSSIRDTYDDNSAKAPVYFNVPLMIGFKYRYDINDIVRPFLEVGIGYDVLFVTKSYGVDNRWYKIKPSGAVCWEIGGGTYLGKNVSVGLHYLGLGRHRMEYRSTSTGREDGSTMPTIKRSIGELALRIGFHF